MTSEFPKWLTYHSWRRILWEEHDSAPLRAITYWQGRQHKIDLSYLKIFQVTETGQMVPRTIQEVLDGIS